MKRFLSNSIGSVLMEAVIVLPLYMLLFGGMMLTGDLVLGGVNLFSANRILAWIAMDRFDVDDNSLVTLAEKQFMHHYDNSDNNEKIWFFDENQKAKKDWASFYEGDQDGGNGGGSTYVTSNSWSALFRASMPLKFNNVPLFYKGALAVNDIMNQNEGEELLYKKKIDFGKRDTFAHYIVKRLPANNRNQDAAELVMSATWIDIAYDNWIQKQDTPSVGPNNINSNNSNSDNYGYSRGLEVFAAEVELEN